MKTKENTSIDVIGEPIFYYLRNSIGIPFGTVCLLHMSNGQYVRGISVCSDGDQFSRKEGRKIALMRADMAANFYRDGRDSIKKFIDDNVILVGSDGLRSNVKMIRNRYAINSFFVDPYRVLGGLEADETWYAYRHGFLKALFTFPIATLTEYEERMCSDKIK